MPEPRVPKAELLHHADGVRRLALRLVRQDADADDIAQETMLAGLQSGAPVDNPAGWLRRVGRNLGLRHLRGQQRVQRRERAGARPEGGGDTSEAVVALESKRRLLEAVGALPDAYRDVLVLRYFEDLAPRHIAAQWDVPVATVKQRLHRARTQLRKVLDAKSGGDRSVWVRGLLPWATLPHSAPAIGGVIMATKSWVVGTGVALLVVGALVLGARALDLWGTGEPEPSPLQARDASGTGRDTGTPDDPVGLTGGGAAQVDPSPGPGVDATGTEVSAPATTTLQVTVLREDTLAPIEGAHVTVLRGNETAAQLETDAEGIARASDLAADVLALRIGARGFATVTSHVTIRLGEQVQREARLPPAAPLRGEVVSASDGTPVGQADVKVTVGQDLFDHDDGVARTRTAADGTFVVPGVPRGLRLVLTVRATGYAPREVHAVLVPAQGAASPQRIELAPDAAVEGVVRDAEGAPRAGAHVYALEVDAPPALRDRPHQAQGSGRKMWKARAGRSDADGRYRIAGLEPGGQYHVWAVADGSVRSPVGVVTRIPRDTRAVPVDLQLRRGAVLEVRVVSSDGAPIEDAKLSVHNDGYYRTALMHAGKGQYRGTGLLPGSLVLTTDAPAHINDVRRLDLHDERTTTVDVALALGAVVTGQAVDDLGDPIANLSVEVRRPYHARYRGLPASRGVGTTDAEGRFTVRGLRTGPHQVAAYKRGYDHASSEIFEAPAKEVRLVMPRRARVHFEVVVPAGAAPPPDVDVMFMMYVRGSEDNYMGAGDTLSWRAGTLRMKNIHSGTGKMEIRCKGFAPYVRKVELTPGVKNDLGRILLDVGSDVAGVVQDVDGAPVAGVVVQHDEQSVTTDSQGRFRLRHLARGETSFTLRHADHLTKEHRLRVVLTLHELRITLEPGALLSGTVRNADGAPDAGLWLHLRRADSDDEVDAPDVDHHGAFSVRLPAGRYHVDVRSKDGVVATRTVDLADGSREKVTLRAER